MNKSIHPMLIAMLLAPMMAASAQTGGATTCATGATVNTHTPATAPTANFTDNGDGTVTDKTTGLMWKRCSQGQDWDGVQETCINGNPHKYTWAAALAAADTDNFAGHTDWRLPNVKELESIVEWRCYYPAINTAPFPLTGHELYLTASLYWSSTPYRLNATRALGVNFYSGGITSGYKPGADLVRLVRTAP